MKFIILDENISCLLDSRLRSLGFSIKRFPPQSGDEYLLREARRLRAALITHDKDFLNFSPRGAGGLLVLRIPSPDIQGMDKSIRNLISKCPVSKWKGKTLILDKEGFIIC